MSRGPGIVLGCLLLSASPSLASQPGERLGSDDVVVVNPRLLAVTAVPVDTAFDYATCDVFPSPIDLRCGLLASNAFDAEAWQYGTRYTHAAASSVLPRTEIWRSRPGSDAEMVAYLEPRAGAGGTFDDGRLETIAVDPVQGEILILLSSACYPPSASACTYGRANEVVKIVGLKSLLQVLASIANSAPEAKGVALAPLPDTRSGAAAPGIKQGASR